MTHEPLSPIRELFTHHAGHVMTVQELAKLTKYSENTITALVRDGHLPAIRIGRAYRILTEQAIVYFESQTIGLEEETPEDSPVLGS